MLDIKEYHERTKHHPHKYADGPGFLDWENQPNPFRFYKGAESIKLGLLQQAIDLPYHRLYELPKTAAQPIDREQIAGFLELALGLSAWKRQGQAEWSLRINPSSGNLHPTECHLILPECSDLPACIAHYNPLLHILEIRSHLAQSAAQELHRMNGFAVILSSIYWREAWKYGERAFRYTQHDIGHALAALRFSATLFGWMLRVRPEAHSSLLDTLLDFDLSNHPGEMEQADCICWIDTGVAAASHDLLGWLQQLQPEEPTNKPNQLSRAHVEWPLVGQAAAASISPGFSRLPLPHDAIARRPASTVSAESIIRQRRSAQAYDPDYSRISMQDFRQLLAATLPHEDGPFDTLATGSNIHLFVFAHQVVGLKPGLYCLIRNSADLEDLTAATNSSFLWSRIDDDLPLYLLTDGDFRQLAEQISCLQPIAGESAFSLGMLARFSPLIDNQPWIYPQLFWEAGFIGQILYLEAEERGLRGTGIGCYFDDTMHRLLGLSGHRWQDLYHFTVGAPLEDKRIQTKPPYYHLDRIPDR